MFIGRQVRAKRHMQWNDGMLQYYMLPYYVLLSTCASRFAPISTEIGFGTVKQYYMLLNYTIISHVRFHADSITLKFKIFSN
jgi:hypothetical protein